MQQYHYNPCALERRVRHWEATEAAEKRAEERRAEAAEKRAEEARAWLAQRVDRAKAALEERRAKLWELEAEAADWFQMLHPSHKRVCKYIIAQRVKVARVECKPTYQEHAVAKFKRSQDYKKAVLQLATKEAKQRLEAYKKATAQMAFHKAFKELVSHQKFTDEVKATVLKHFSQMLFKHNGRLLWTALM